MNSTRNRVLLRCRQLPAILLFAWVIAGHALTSGAANINGVENLRYEFSVRALQPAELPKDRSGEWMQFFAPGMASAALGLVAAPMYASGLIVGGIILAPGALIISSMERRTWERMVTALQASDFEQLLLRATEARARTALPPPAPSSPTEPVSVELVVNAYGLARQDPGHLCFIASMDLIASRAGKVWLRDRLIVSPLERSADAPPPQCASNERMAENDGQMVRNTAAIYAEILGIMVVDRLLAQGTK